MALLLFGLFLWLGVRFSGSVAARSVYPRQLTVPPWLRWAVALDASERRAATSPTGASVSRRIALAVELTLTVAVVLFPVVAVVVRADPPPSFDVTAIAVAYVGAIVAWFVLLLRGLHSRST